MTDPVTLRRMRVLAIHRYYWPDTPPYASMLRAIVARWAQDGHHVEVFSTQPSYKQGLRISRQPAREVLDGVTVHRTELPDEHRRPLVRIVNVIRFAVAILRQARRGGPYDVIMASTAPPVLISAAARLAAKRSGAAFVYHCMDIHPELGRISGEFRNRVVFSILRWIDVATCRAAARVIVLSRDMEQAIRSRRGAAAVKVTILNNFDIPSYADVRPEPLAEYLRKPEGRFRLLFAGNLGRFQGLESVIDAMHRLSGEPQIELLMVGEGRALPDLKRRAGVLLGNQIQFIPHQSVDVARAIVRTADLCLVTLTPNVWRFAYPSKTITYLSEGRPLLVAVESESELAEFVAREGVGVAVRPNDAEAMASAIVRLAQDRERCAQMARRASRVGEEQFERSAVLDRWAALMRELATAEAAHGVRAFNVERRG